MTRKDFQLIADALARAKPASVDNETSERDQQWARDVDSITDALAPNPRFDRAWFQAACMRGAPHIPGLDDLTGKDE